MRCSCGACPGRRDLVVAGGGIDQEHRAGPTDRYFQSLRISSNSLRFLTGFKAFGGARAVASPCRDSISHHLRRARTTALSSAASCMFRKVSVAGAIARPCMDLRQRSIVALGAASGKTCSGSLLELVPRRQVVFAAGTNGLHKRIRPFGYAVGQDGDPRVVLLIRGTASRCHFPP